MSLTWKNFKIIIDHKMVFLVSVESVLSFIRCQPIRLVQVIPISFSLSNQVVLLFMNLCQIKAPQKMTVLIMNIDLIPSEAANNPPINGPAIFPSRRPL